MKQYKVSVKKVSEYNYEFVYSSIKEAIEDIGGIQTFIKPGEKVLLKPNLLGAFHPDKAITTHPVIVKAVINIVREAGAVPFVGDSPAFQPFLSVAKASKIKVVCDAENVELVNLNNKTEVDNKEAVIDKYTALSEQLNRFDKIINLPKLKNHVLTKITVAVKNIFGVVPGTTKSMYHYRYKDIRNFSHMLLDIHLLVKPVLNIVDGILALEGEGPAASGKPRKANVIIAGNDAVATDIVAAEIMNYNPYSIVYLGLARDRKQGGYSFDLIDLYGEDIEKVKLKDFIHAQGQTSTELFPGFVGKIISRFFIKKPFVNFDKCIGCSDCAKICPPQTIKIINNKAVINYDNCIKCYCCIEACPYDAIVRKRLWSVG